MLSKVTLKELFGVELNLTEFFRDNKNFQQQIFDAIGFKYEANNEKVRVSHQDSFPEARIDNSVWVNDIRKIIFEFQFGKQDFAHSTKIDGYMWLAGVNDGVLVVEDYTQSLIDYLRDKPSNILVLLIKAWTDKSNIDPSSALYDFQLLYKPNTFETKSRRVTENVERVINNSSVRINDNENDPIFTLWRLHHSNGETYIQQVKKDATRIKGRRNINSPEGIETAKYYCYSNDSNSFARTLASIDDIIKVDYLGCSNDENEIIQMKSNFK